MNRRWLIAVLLLPCLLLCACAPKETVSPYADIPKPTAVITMENGSTMTFTLDPASAPNTVSNFISLANAGFYDGMKIDYVYPTYFLRSGDPNGNGTGGSGYSIKGEFSANGFDNKLSHTRGVISMARSSSFDSAGSQFFIMHADGTYLDTQYAAFGEVVDGMDVVDAIAETQTGANDRPVSEQKIKSIRVDTKGVEYNVEKIGG